MTDKPQTTKIIIAILVFTACIYGAYKTGKNSIEHYWNLYTVVQDKEGLNTVNQISWWTQYECEDYRNQITNGLRKDLYGCKDGCTLVFNRCIREWNDK